MGQERERAAWKEKEDAKEEKAKKARAAAQEAWRARCRDYEIVERREKKKRE